MSSKLSSLFAVVASLFSLVLLTTPGEPQQKALRPVRLNVFIYDGGVAAAGARGLFAPEGLEVNTTVTRSSTEQMRGIGAGTYDIAQTSFDNVLAWSGREGAEIVAVAQQVDTAILPVFVRPEIRDWSDLRGKKLAVDAVDTAFSLTLRRILLARGLDLKRGDFELVGVGAPVPRLESMKRGETFAAILNPPFDAQGAAAGMVRLLDEKYPGFVWVANRAWAQSHKTDLVGFLRAWLAGVRWAKEPANREEAIKLIMAATGYPQAAVSGRLLTDLPADGALNLANLQAVLNIRKEFGTPPPLGAALDRFYDQSYYREAVRP
jgi:ABC-type nitrate/sulfonate/bicarbonate transport system substrate-binding protein